MSFLSYINKFNKKKKSSLNHSYFYQDIAALKLSNNNKKEKEKENSKTALESLGNTNLINNSEEEKKNQNTKENELSKRDDNSVDIDIKKVKTIDNSAKQRRRFFTNRVKNVLNNNHSINYDEYKKNKIDLEKS